MKDEFLHIYDIIHHHEGPVLTQRLHKWRSEINTSLHGAALLSDTNFHLKSIHPSSFSQTLPAGADG